MHLLFYDHYRKKKINYCIISVQKSVALLKSKGGKISKGDENLETHLIPWRDFLGEAADRGDPDGSPTGRNWYCANWKRQRPDATYRGTARRTLEHRRPPWRCLDRGPRLHPMAVSNRLRLRQRQNTQRQYAAPSKSRQATPNTEQQKEMPSAARRRSPVTVDWLDLQPLCNPSSPCPENSIVMRASDSSSLHRDRRTMVGERPKVAKNQKTDFSSISFINFKDQS